MVAVVNVTIKTIILQTLTRAMPKAMTVAELSVLMGRSENALRYRLAELMHDGCAEHAGKVTNPATGKPILLYRATGKPRPPRPKPKPKPSDHEPLGLIEDLWSPEIKRAVATLRPDYAVWPIAGTDQWWCGDRRLTTDALMDKADRVVARSKGKVR